MIATPFDLTLELTDIATMLRDRAQRQPERRAYTFLVDGESREAHLTYGDLDRQARAIAARIQAISPPQTPVLLLYPQGLEFVAAFFGCAYAGVPAVPAYPPRRNQKTARLRAIAADSGARVALTVRSVGEDVRSRFADAPDLGALEWVATDDIDLNGANDWQPPDISPESLAFLQYTSGSTGTPKGVMVTHANILHNSETIRRSFRLSEDSVSVTWLPSFHDMGLIDGILQPFYSNFLGVVMSPAAFLQKPLRWLQAISRYGATHCGGPNLGYDLCATKIAPEHFASLDLSRWQSAYSGAEPVRRATLDRFAETFAPCGFKPEFFYPCYGLAEATLMVSGGDLTAAPVYCEVDGAALEQNQVKPAAAGRSLVGCGRAWLDTDIAIVDPETHAELDG
ncbi:MAG: AMP-binding protein, partial [Cyanobacteria bacterium J06639_1]